MLNLFLTPTSIVFEDMTDELYLHLKEKYHLDFEIDEGEYKIVEEPNYLFKILLKLSYEYDIELH